MGQRDRKRKTDNLLVDHPSGKCSKALDPRRAALLGQNYHPPEWLASSPRCSAGQEKSGAAGLSPVVSDSGAICPVGEPKMKPSENVRIFTLNVRGLRSRGKYEDLNVLLNDFKVHI